MNRVATRDEVATRSGNGNDEPAGEANSLAELASQHAPAIRCAAFRLTRSHSAAQEITQEVLLRVCRLGGYDPSRGSIEQWLQMTTRGASIDWIRREAAHDRRVAHVGAIHVATMQAVEDVVEARFQAAIVRAAVAQLPEDEQLAVSLAYFEGLTYRQVALRLGVPEGTIKSQIRRALARLAHLIAPSHVIGTLDNP